MPGTILTNYDLDFYRDEAYRNCKDDFEELLANEEEHLFEDESDFHFDCIEKWLKTHIMRAKGYIERWDGRKGGYADIRNMGEFYELMRDCDYYELAYDDDDNLTLRCSHHDGTNFYTLFELENDIEKKLEIEWCL